jgi:hypothetical protein
MTGYLSFFLILQVDYGLTSSSVEDGFDNAVLSVASQTGELSRGN